MNNYIESFTGFYDGLSIYLEKYAQRPERDKNHASILQLAGDYYEEYQAFLQEYEGNDFLHEACKLLLEIQAAVEEHNLEMLKSLRANSEMLIQNEKNRTMYVEKFSEIFQTDVQQMKLQEEKIKSCQALVDMDLKIYGELSATTKEVLEVQQVELVEGKVRERQENFIQGDTSSLSQLYDSGLNDMEGYLKQHEEKLKTLEKTSGKKTLVVNAYAGPGAGKTTACLATVAELKKKGYVAEYVPEYAKELVYDHPELLDGSKEHQLHILEEQLKRLDRFMGKVDIIVTDASILLNPVYMKEQDPEYAKAISSLYKQYENFNFFVHRGEEFIQEGRMENREESIQKDQQIRDILDENDIFYGNFNHKTVDKLSEKIEVTFGRINNTQDKLKESFQHHEESYQAYAYLKKLTNKPTVIFGNSPENLLTKLQRWNMTRTEEMKFHSCYIRKLNPETNRYENTTRFEVESGKDITPIYLNIPHMESDDFKKAVEQLKKNGAKYNYKKKAFYITKAENDLNLFADYLPINGTYAAEGANRSRNELPFKVDVLQNNSLEITVEGKVPFVVSGEDYNMDFSTIPQNDIDEFVDKFILPDKMLKSAELPQKRAESHIDDKKSVRSKLEANLSKIEASERNPNELQKAVNER